MKRLPRRLVYSVLIAFFVLSSISVTSVAAGWMQCRSDPAVILSNGLVLDLSADISTLPWAVQHVDYVLHVPQGVSLVASVATPTWPTSIETFTLYDDAAPGQYNVETIVHTSLGNATVTAHTVLVSALGVQLDAISTAGFEGQILHTYIHVP